MSNFIWRGHIVPVEGTQGITYNGHFVESLGEGIGRIEGRIVIRGARCTVRVAADPRISPQQLANNVRSTAAGILDALGFLDGHGRIFVLESGRDLDTGADFMWPGSVPELALDPAPHNGQLDELLKAFKLTPLLGDALADYRRAMLEPWDSGFYAFRCIETIQRYWQGDSERRTGATWEAMRQALGVERPDIDALKHWADLQRHGGRRTISSEDHTRLLLVSRDTLRKFSSYLLQQDELANTLQHLGSPES